MRDALQRLCIVAVLCVGSLAFIATSYPSLDHVTHTTTPVTIRLTKERPVRQFALFVKEKDSDIQFSGSSHAFTFELDGRSTVNPVEDQDSPVHFALSTQSHKVTSDHCFTPHVVCDWDVHQIGVTPPDGEVPNQPFDFRPSEPLRFAQIFGATLKGKWLFVKFTLKQDKPARIQWQYTFTKSYSIQANEDVAVNSTMLNVSVQEVPVD